VTWTLAPTIGNQVVTVTSTAIPGVSATFLAGNGASISGTVATTDALAFSPVFSRAVPRPGGSSRLATAASHVRRSNQIIVGFKGGAMGSTAVGAMANRSMSAAQATSSRMKTRLDALLAQRAVRDVRLSPAILTARITVADTSLVDETIRLLAAEPDVAYAQRDAVLSIRDHAPHAMVADRALIGTGGRDASQQGKPAATSVATRIPNDANYFVQTWSANMLDLPKAWGITTGSAAVTVAVVDMGVRFTHPSMGNLTADGYDFVTPFALPTPELFCDGVTMLTSTEGDGDGPDADPTDPDDIEFDQFRGCWFHSSSGDHGLWTAGIIGAVGNQGIGIAGVNWTVKLRPIRVLDITGSGDFFDIAQGILYAAGLPAAGAGGAVVQTTAAPIINVSLGGTDDVPVLASAVAAAVSAGSLIVASAGNDGLDDVVPNYPASYPGVMAVAAVGMDGVLATYSNAGTKISVAAPGGDFRLDDNGGGGILGPGWNFNLGGPNLIFGYGTSGAAPFVSGIAALLLAQTPGLTATQLRSRIETFATRPPNALRSDTYGWGIVNAYNALTQRNGAPRETMLRLIDATTGAVTATTHADAAGNFAFTKLDNGAYLLQAGEDEAGDGVIGEPGRRFTWAGGFGAPRIFNIANNNSLTATIALGQPLEAEPNDDVAHANLLSVNSYVIGSITPPDPRDMYAVTIPAAGTYVVETSGVLGTCGWGIELDTFISLATATGALAGLSDNFVSATSDNCSQVQQTLQPGIYYVTVVGTGASGLASHGRYRLEVRAVP
jgi:serine protease